MSAEDTGVVLNVEGLSKKFCRGLRRSLFYGLQDIAAESLGLSRGSDVLRPGEFWAVRDVSFQVRRGASLALVGANGAGKSTLLRLVSGLIKPDVGTLTVRGRVAPLIALGAGFSPVLTGRENIYANMAILGLTTKEIDVRLADVLEFADIGDVLNAPVQTYSSGMTARLGFACAIHTDPDILLIDEVLAVGDIKFRIKCFQRLARLRERGTAFVLVSHNPHSITAVCDSAIYLSKGRLVTAGDTDAVLNTYERDLFPGGAESTQGPMSFPGKGTQDSAGLDISAVGFRDLQGHSLKQPVSGDPATLRIACYAHRRIEGVGVSVIIREAFGDGDCVLALDSRKDTGSFAVSKGQTEIRLHLPSCGLRPGSYSAKINLNLKSIDILDGVEAFRFVVAEGAGGSVGPSKFFQARSWQLAATPSSNP